ncbi:MAG: DUF1353 domain-containing protein [Candidatus Gastranaerophilaceae bacterium]
MITYCNNNFLKITSDVEPCLTVQVPLEIYGKEEQEIIKEKPFLNKRHILFNFYYGAEQYCLLFNKGYRWDGATIPPGVRWIIGPPSHPAFLLASMVHDKLCENHYLIDNDRYLSSLIFKELLIASDVSSFKANIMFYAVDNFQKFFGGWKE